ncbi:MAG: glycosyl hydrolase family 28-related protein [bacterium]|jgi:hypothetical protein
MMLQGHTYSAICLLLSLSILAVSPSAEEYSQLWGKNGELWSADSRLPDFSHAGYHRGEKPVPEIAVTANVRDFGAVGDGEHDDTQAFLDAIRQTSQGAILVPAGRYKITDIIEIEKPNIVLRGESPDNTILYFPINLNDIRPNWGATTGGRKTSNYSWSGGFIWLRGSFQSSLLVKDMEEAKRGDTQIVVSDSSRLQEGQLIEIRVTDNDDNTLADHLYSGDPGEVSELRGRTRASLVATVLSINDKTITIDRPLRFDLQSQWNPQIYSYSPTVQEVGIENLCFEFPVEKYDGHFTELGHNALAMSSVANCWVRNIRIVNPDSGLFIGGKFNTINGVIFESERPPDNSNNTGHHGIYISTDDNLFNGFDFRMRFIHDISVSHCAGNVISNGRGMDLCFDHHKRAPYENLFTNIDLGAGTRMWRSGGGADLGRHCGARGTFWNIRAKQPQAHPGSFGPASMNLVGVQTRRSSITEPEGIWFEAIAPDILSPQNLHKAQLARRLNRATSIKDPLMR